jgi:phospholipid-translocating ATPase
LRSSNGKEFEYENLGDNQDKQFFRMVGVLLTCHAVYPKLDQYGFRELESTSPDEISFIEFCEKAGFQLKQRTDHVVSFQTPDKRLFEFRILKVFGFTSARKRMGIILEWQGKVLYFLKGADSIMIPMLKKEFVDKATEETGVLSAQGLRTLVVA